MVTRIATRVRRAGAHVIRHRLRQRPMELRVRVDADDEDGGYIAEIVGLPGVMSQGDTEEEALANVIDALACYVQAEAAPVANHTKTTGSHEHRIPLYA